MALHRPPPVKQGRSNQVAKLLALQNLTCVHSVDSLKLARKLSQRAAAVRDTQLDVMLQLKPECYFSMEQARSMLKTGQSEAQDPIKYAFTKSGLGVAQLAQALQFVLREQASLRLVGLMVIGEPGDSRLFDTMRHIRSAVQTEWSLETDLGSPTNNQSCRWE